MTDSEKEELLTRLDHFVRTCGVNTQGPLSIVLVITRRASRDGLPLDADALLTSRGGQVSGLGGTAVQRILREHGITRMLAREGGRTSRGSIETMRSYVGFLNQLHLDGLADLEEIEKWWVGQVREFFARRPFKLKLDPSKSFRAVIKDLIAQALERQKEMPGTMFAGAVLQHLVGAKLEILVPPGEIDHHGFSVADGPTARYGDFRLEDVVIHVTTAPTEALVQKCVDNLAAGMRPIIVTTGQGAGGAEALATAVGIDGRIDIFEIEQFMAANIYELSRFSQDQRRQTIDEIIQRYNLIVSTCETDQSLKIEAV